MIGLIKQAVKKTLGRAFILHQQLETIVAEVEAMLNDTLTTYASSDLADLEPISHHPTCCIGEEYR